MAGRSCFLAVGDASRARRSAATTQRIPASPAPRDRLAFSQRHLDTIMFDRRPSPTEAVAPSSSLRDGPGTFHRMAAGLRSLGPVRPVRDLGSGGRGIEPCPADPLRRPFRQDTLVVARWPPTRIRRCGRARGNSRLSYAEGGRRTQITDRAASRRWQAGRATDKWIYFASNRRGDARSGKRQPTADARSNHETRGIRSIRVARRQVRCMISKGVDVGGLWRVAVSGGEETAVLDFPVARLWGYWALVNTGIYFVNSEFSPGRPSNSGFRCGPGFAVLGAGGTSCFG